MPELRILFHQVPITDYILETITPPFIIQPLLMNAHMLNTTAPTQSPTPAQSTPCFSAAPLMRTLSRTTGTSVPDARQGCVHRRGSAKASLGTVTGRATRSRTEFNLAKQIGTRGSQDEQGCATAYGCQNALSNNSVALDMELAPEKSARRYVPSKRVYWPYPTSSTRLRYKRSPFVDTLGRPYGFKNQDDVVPLLAKDSRRPHTHTHRKKSKAYKGHYLELPDIDPGSDSSNSDSPSDGGYGDRYEHVNRRGKTRCLPEVVEVLDNGDRFTDDNLSLLLAQRYGG